MTEIRGSVDLCEVRTLVAKQVGECMELIRREAEKLYELGVRERFIDADKGFDYAYHVFVSAVCGLHLALTMPALHPEKNGQAEAHAWGMLRRALA